MTVTLHLGDCAKILQEMEPESIDLTVTSPPYDNLRKYKGYTFDFEPIARELYRVTKPGGVVVWVVGDATIKGSETGTSFRQALYFMECGFRLHDTMIYAKSGFRYPFPNRYHQTFEYMFVLSKESPSTYNLLADRKNKHVRESANLKREADGTKTYRKPYMASEWGRRYNIWMYDIGGGKDSGTDTNHPAIFPEALARDHIISWSNPGDVVLDPFLGSGTTGKMAVLNDRNFIGIEIAAEYLEIAERRIKQAQEARQLELQGVE